MPDALEKKGQWIGTAEKSGKEQKWLDKGRVPEYKPDVRFFSRRPPSLFSRSTGRPGLQRPLGGIYMSISQTLTL